MAAIVGLALAERLQSAHDHDTFEVSVFLKVEPARALDAASASAQPLSRTSRVEQMQQAAARDQTGLLGFLTEQRSTNTTFDDGTSVPNVTHVQSFWINNSVTVTLSRTTLKQVIERTDVYMVEIARHAPIEELFDATTARATEAAPALASASTETWSVRLINAPLLWQAGVDGTGAVVAVVDSGVNYKHPDLDGQMWQAPQFPHHGYDFDANDNDPMDSQGHGTCCAGIVAGSGALGKATGVAPRAKIMAIRVGGAETNFWNGLQFAIANGAHVISMSMTWKVPMHPDYPGWRRACESILAAGVLHANSIGNQGTDLVNYPLPNNVATPGNCPPPWLHPLQPTLGGKASPISCGATDSMDNLANYSGRGPAGWEAPPYTDYPYQGGTKPGLVKPDVCAPGPGTESCNYLYGIDPSAKPYTGFGGTSAATPHVGGCLALLASACLKTGTPIVPENIQEALESTAVPISGQTTKKENHYGSGRVDVKAAFDYGRSKGWW